MSNLKSCGETVHKYLTRSASSSTLRAARALQQAGVPLVDSALVVPAYGEGAAFIERLVEGPRPLGPYLFVVVVNAKASSPTPVRVANDETRRAMVAALGPGRAVTGHLHWWTTGRGGWIRWDWDRADQCLRPSEGVGRARQLGSELATALCHVTAWGEGADGPTPTAVRQARVWLAHTDADATLPSDYFEQLSACTADAAVFPFRHVAATGWDDEAQQYDLWLRYNAVGLHSARSPYAFVSIGSCMAATSQLHAEVRGVPNRTAGEDFHYLNKLAQHGSLEELDGSPIELQARPETRVPVGTAAGIQAIRAGRPPHFVSPRGFAVLQAIYAATGSLAETSDGTQFRHGLRALIDDRRALEVLESQLDFEAWYRAGADQPTASMRTRQWQRYFNGLRSWRLLRGLSPSPLAWDEATGSAPFGPGAPPSGAKTASLAETARRWYAHHREQPRVTRGIKGSMRRAA